MKRYFKIKPWSLLLILNNSTWRKMPIFIQHLWSYQKGIFIIGVTFPHMIHKFKNRFLPQAVIEVNEKNLKKRKKKKKREYNLILQVSFSLTHKRRQCLTTLWSNLSLPVFVTHTFPVPLAILLFKQRDVFAKFEPLVNLNHFF